MEAGNGMPFQLRQLLCMSTSFKTLGKSCKCSSNEIGLSATSKHIPAAPKCLFAMGLRGDCVNRSAFKGTCQEKFRSSTRQWHWNAAFSRTVTYINPEKKKASTSSHGFCFVWGAFPHQNSRLSGISVHKVLCKGCISKLQTEVCFLLGCLRMGSW